MSIQNRLQRRLNSVLFIRSAPDLQEAEQRYEVCMLGEKDTGAQLLTQLRTLSPLTKDKVIKWAFDRQPFPACVEGQKCVDVEVLQELRTYALLGWLASAVETSIEWDPTLEEAGALFSLLGSIAIDLKGGSALWVALTKPPKRGGIASRSERGLT